MIEKNLTETDVNIGASRDRLRQSLQTRSSSTRLNLTQTRFSMLTKLLRIPSHFKSRISGLLIFSIATAFLVLGASAPVAAQQYEYVVTGTVIDATGNSIPLVNIRLKDTVVGTATDVNGVYELKIVVDRQTAILVFSSIG